LDLGRSRRAPVRVALSLVTLAFLGCSGHRDQATADLDVPAAYRASTATAGAAWPSGAWWTGFGSPELTDLIERARTRNFDIQAAIARVRQADAQMRIAGAALLPALNGTASAGWEHLGINAGGSSSRGRAGSKCPADIRSNWVGQCAA
jgi:multidrug efflux system outer membrane protein